MRVRKVTLKEGEQVLLTTATGHSLLCTQRNSRELYLSDMDKHGVLETWPQTMGDVSVVFTEGKERRQC